MLLSRRTCATHALIHNCISFLFASVLIGINIAFIRRPSTCFFTTRICQSLRWDRAISFSFQCSYNGRSNHCDSTRMILIKAQLAGGAIIAATCFIYLIMYFIVSSRAARTNRQRVRTINDSVMAPVYPHQTFTTPQSFQPSAPIMMPAYHQVPPQYQNPSYIPPNQYPTIYPQIPQDRF
ncbi:hypothetical protein I4U23_000998 [Adineta vaga]|nr:hypothetical protein I4U23_000998 [Adineta vaga]